MSALARPVRWLRSLTPWRLVALVVAILVVAGLATAMGGGSGTRTVTAHFSRAVSVYKGTDVDIMGVRVGRVVSVKPDGDSVEVVMEYDARYQLPAQVKAAIVTPTLVADRFVQLAPAYTGGATLADGGQIPKARTAVPVEMDEIYKSVADLTDALGPDGANKGGALDNALKAGATALDGNGKLGNEMLANLSQVAKTLDDNSGNLFDTLDGLNDITTTLNQNDGTVQQFMKHLAKVSQQLSGESGDLQHALSSIADAVDITRDFVKDNKTKLTGDISGLTTTLKVLADEKESLGTTLQLAPLGLGDLADSFDMGTGTEGIRLQLGPTGMDLPGLLCGIVTNDRLPGGKALCSLFKALIPNTLATTVGAGLTNAGVPAAVVNGTSSLSSLAQQVQGLVGGGAAK
jgi:phospholipid/cholesterol/gamma-HCH transport system substrate-binding protein